MKGILRVHKVKNDRDTIYRTEGETPPRTDGLEDYFQRLYKLIPGEIMGLYLIGSGVIPEDDGYVLVGWSFFCAIGLVLLRYRLTSDDNQNPQKGAIVIALISFLIWIYTLGGPFKLVDGLFIPYVGSLLVLGWTFLVPIFYKGDQE